MLDLIKKRRSIRAYTDEPNLLKMLEAKTSKVCTK